nr:response regulator transcription factor [uncultured Trichococcus sp.]
MSEEIYIAEDEDGIRLTVKTFLESEGYVVSDFPNGDLLFDAFLNKQPDLVILDVMMPGSSGFEITKKIRDISSVPIIILTAKDSDMDYATGINLGSDDYFTKPFSAIALNMRVKAMLRRIKMDQERMPSRKQEEMLRIGDIEIDLAAMSVKQNGASLNLTPNEYNVFVYLIENKNRAVSRDELLDSIWGYGKDIETRACDDTVRRLRKKLAGSTVEIETVWGFGFTVKESSAG